LPPSPQIWGSKSDKLILKAPRIGGLGASIKQIDRQMTCVYTVAQFWGEWGEQ
jgi:hypothetical protein